MPIRSDPWPAGTPCWVDLGAADVAASTEFYGAVLGWTFVDTGEEFGHYNIGQVNGHIRPRRCTVGWYRRNDGHRGRSAVPLGALLLDRGHRRRRAAATGRGGVLQGPVMTHRLAGWRFSPIPTAPCSRSPDHHPHSCSVRVCPGASGVVGMVGARAPEFPERLQQARLGFGGRLSELTSPSVATVSRICSTYRAHPGHKSRCVSRAVVVVGVQVAFEVGGDQLDDLAAAEHPRRGLGHSLPRASARMIVASTDVIVESCERLRRYKLVAESAVARVRHGSTPPARPAGHRGRGAAGCVDCPATGRAARTPRRR